MYGHSSFANEEKCKQWRQQRFTYSTVDKKRKQNYQYHEWEN